MDSGLGFVQVANTIVSPVIISNSDVKSGSHLRFRYRAQNVYGWSEYSDVSVIVAATVPNPPTQVMVVSTQLNTYITFNWTSPLNTGGNAVLIENYTV